MAGQSSPGRRGRERFLVGIQEGGPGRKNREAGGRMTLTRLFLPFGRLQKEGLRRPEANTKKIRRAEDEKGKGNKNPGGMIFE